MAFVPNVMCFNWNTDKVPLCDKYYHKDNNEIRGLVSPKNCYNPLFAKSIFDKIRTYDPMIVTFVTEGDLQTKTYLHSDFLPDNMLDLGYFLLIRDKLSNDTSTIRMSIYTKVDDDITYSIELSKNWLINDNNYECSLESNNDRSQRIPPKILNNSNHTINGTTNLNRDNVKPSIPRSLILYINTRYGNIAFIAIQIPHNFDKKSICIDMIDKKFIHNKDVDYVFLMGDFATNYIVNKQQYNDFIYMEGIKNQSIPRTYSECDISHSLTWYPNYNLHTGVQYDPSNINSYIPYDKDKYIISWHDRIFYKNIHSFGKKRKYKISCLLYETITGFPMNNIPESNHLGVIGIFEILPNLSTNDEQILFSKPSYSNILPGI